MSYTQSITRLRAPLVTDRYGNEVRDWSDEEALDRLVIHNLHVQPTSTTENLDDGRDRVMAGWRVFSRPGVDVDVGPDDRIRYGSRDCEVLGAIDRFPHPVKRGQVHHVEFDMERRTG